MVRQVLSDESLNDRGFRVMNKSIKWDRYLKNPVLVEQHMSWEPVIVQPLSVADCFCSSVNLLYAVEFKDNVLVVVTFPNPSIMLCRDSRLKYLD